jgi:flagellar biosynthetic protein FlhB
LGDEIPHKLYNVVAEVLAYVYQLRRYQKSSETGEHAGKVPQFPDDLPVPAELDPGE